MSYKEMLTSCQAKIFIYTKVTLPNLRLAKMAVKFVLYKVVLW